MTDRQAAKRLRTTEIELLREVLQQRAPELLPFFLAKAQANTLDRAERVYLCELITLELAETGIGADSEPNARGLQLENLLDAVLLPNIGADLRSDR
jgi:hypothetical protein